MFILTEYDQYLENKSVMGGSDELKNCIGHAMKAANKLLLEHNVHGVSKGTVKTVEHTLGINIYYKSDVNTILRTWTILEIPTLKDDYV